jgi:hypothetical protein
MKNGKVIALRDCITISWTYLTLALIQVIKNLEGKTNPTSIVVLNTKVALEGRADLEIGVESEKKRNN